MLWKTMFTELDELVEPVRKVLRIRFSLMVIRNAPPSLWKPFERPNKKSLLNFRQWLDLDLVAVAAVAGAEVAMDTMAEVAVEVEATWVEAVAAAEASGAVEEVEVADMVDMVVAVAMGVDRAENE